MTKTHDTLTAAEALIIAEALNYRASYFRQLLVSQPAADPQARQIWEDAARERNELACKIIDATKDGDLVPFSCLLSDGARTRYMERRIARQCITDLLEAGFEVGVNDGEEDVLIGGKEWSRDADAIFAEMFHTDECRLIARSVRGPERTRGWVLFIYGNSGHDVINDYTTNLEGVLADTTALSEKLEG